MITICAYEHKILLVINEVPVYGFASFDNFAHMYLWNIKHHDVLFVLAADNR